MPTWSPSATSTRQEVSKALINRQVRFDWSSVGFRAASRSDRPGSSVARRPKVAPGGVSQWASRSTSSSATSAITRKHPDFDALAVADHILGSGPGFTDRLSRVIRDELGLAYSVGGGMTDSADIEPGLFRDLASAPAPTRPTGPWPRPWSRSGSFTRGSSATTRSTRARQYLAGSWVFDYQTVEQRAERIVELAWWGLPLDEPTHWPDRIATITPNQVRAATRAHIDPNALIRVEYGPIHRRDRDAKVECA